MNTCPVFSAPEIRARSGQSSAGLQGSWETVISTSDLGACRAELPGRRPSGPHGPRPLTVRGLSVFKASHTPRLAGAPSFPCLTH